MPVLTAPDQMLIEVRAASLDFLDIKICSGYGRVLRRQLHKYTAVSNTQAYIIFLKISKFYFYFFFLQSTPKELPVVLGRDCSGVVVDIGHDVKNFEVC